MQHLMPAEFVISLTLAQGTRFEEISVVAHMCDLAWDASVQYRFGADGVLWALGMCQYCRWAKSVEILSWFWYVTLKMLLWLYLFYFTSLFWTALCLPSLLPVDKSFLLV